MVEQHLNVDANKNGCCLRLFDDDLRETGDEDSQTNWISRQMGEIIKKQERSRVQHLKRNWGDLLSYFLVLSLSLSLSLLFIIRDWGRGWGHLSFVIDATDGPVVCRGNKSEKSTRRSRRS